ncbi:MULTISPECIES: proline--tRNA ligase [unclassified Achromobacter]|uniref:proline--tRNA ligase n=1 Tax=unclassified Achromobacter TaxID=2626865 RepID=UPI000B5161B5|nr:MULTISPECIES: proline--tRNA ligase [unclassified Achromobacter]OWT73383.1 proline--tRNA ligase [Achromobacter sp. HZ34]OWT79700.1 proline--tRNA ligase [Achromobacter sp. HZ28]
MRASNYHINTLKEAPAEAEVVSHQLMTRAGMIRKLAGGIYTYMPLGLRVIRKIENIVRQEMNAAGAIELLMPVVQPAELWQESGRWVQYGLELLRIKDRHDREFVLQPTSEEVITDIARNEIHSWRQLPVNFYHIQTKFRDERRPRFGLMRGREFTMKDAYSFDRDESSALASYDIMYAAYMKIFTRLGLEFRAVAADTGSIGGTRSHEFQVIADTGEDLIVYNPDSQYAANIELAESGPLIAERGAASRALEAVPTPGAAKCEDVAALLQIPLATTVKSIVLATEPEKGPVQIWLLLLRGDHTLNEIKAAKVAGLKDGFRFATEAEIVEHFGCKPGYLGPIKTAKPVRVVADATVAKMHDIVCGANREDFHYVGMNWGRDLPEPEAVADLRNVVAGDPAPDGAGTLAIQRGIEVGHVFFLGTKYSEALKATFLDETGKPAVIQMGCYGIGVTRIAAAAIEQNHDDKGIIWPRPIAPFEVVICPVGWGKSETVRNTANDLYEALRERGIDVLLDDRDARPGVMFAEWELIGVPLRVTVGERGLKDGVLELQARRETEAAKVGLDEALDQILAKLDTL